MDETIDTDVLIVGGGPAGCRAALRAHELGARVLLVEKAHISRSGGALYAHSFEAPQPPMSSARRRQWLKEYVENSSYLIDQDQLQAFTDTAQERVRELESWGVAFERDEKGGLKYVPFGFGRDITVLQADGVQVMEVMRRQVERSGIPILERVTITDLLTSDGENPTGGRVVGAVGFHTRRGQFYVIQARATVLATGPFTSKLHYTHLDNLTGEGQMAAFRAGAELAGLEFCHHSRFAFWARRFPGHGQSQQIALGARVINARGERIMERYHPERRERAGMSSICRAVVTEMLEGRGPCFVDMTHFSPEDVAVLRRTAATTMAAFDEFGIDILKEPVEVTPYTMLGLSGGIKVDARGATNLPGLLAAGSVTYGGSGSSNSAAIGGAMGAITLGYGTGEAAWEAAQEAGKAHLSSQQVNRLRNEAFAPLRQDGQEKALNIIYALNRIVTPAPYSFFKREDRLREALARIRRLATERLPLVSAPDIHELVKANEARNVVAMAELGYLAALERKESRGEKLFREDYPYRDDANWLKWIVARREGDETRLSFWPLPFQRYPIQPAKRERIPFTLHVPAFPAELLNEVAL
ncbi:MAG: FAD-binding protein [Chloroflexi bacterium]|nr:FAD-binding protein [Chloroflexota bacterium]